MRRRQTIWGAPDAVAGLGEEVCGRSAACLPGQGQLRPEQLEIARLKREVTRLKAERDILKKAAAYFAKESM
jgi:transposase